MFGEFFSVYLNNANANSFISSIPIHTLFVFSLCLSYFDEYAL